MVDAKCFFPIETSSKGRGWVLFFRAISSRGGSEASYVSRAPHLVRLCEAG